MLFIPVVNVVADIAIQVAASKALTKYLSPVKKIERSNIPVVKKTTAPTPTRSKTERVADYASLVADVSTLLKNSGDTLNRTITRSTKQLEEVTKTQTTSTSKALETYKNSPLLRNQLLQKQSMDAISNVLERMLLKQQELFQPIANNLTAMDTSLQAINTTLMEFAPTLGLVSELLQMKLTLEMTPRNMYDLDGQLVKTNLSPYELSLARQVAHARGETDENNIGGDLIGELTDIYDSSELNALKFFSYMGFSDSYASINAKDDSIFETALNNWKKGQ